MVVKEHQAVGNQDALSPLTGADGATASCNEEEASPLAELFANKMTVGDPEGPPPQLPQEMDSTVADVSLTTEHVERLFNAVGVSKASGSDSLSPWL